MEPTGSGNRDLAMALAGNYFSFMYLVECANDGFDHPIGIPYAFSLASTRAHTLKIDAMKTPESRNGRMVDCALCTGVLRSPRRQHLQRQAIVVRPQSQLALHVPIHVVAASCQFHEAHANIGQWTHLFISSMVSFLLSSLTL